MTMANPEDVTVPFEPEEVKAFLDHAITHWRDQRDDPESQFHDIAIYYVDAFQSVRMSLFGELLP